MTGIHLLIHKYFATSVFAFILTVHVWLVIGYIEQGALACYWLENQFYQEVDQIEDLRRYSRVSLGQGIPAIQDS